jgi:hypothetical protein
VLTLLSAILSDEAAKWPYGVANVLERISEARPEVSDDPERVNDFDTAGLVI